MATTIQQSTDRLGMLSALTLVLALLIVSASGAQRGGWSGPSPEQMVEEHLTRMTEELALTDEQVPRVRPIIEEHMARMRELMEKHQQQGRRPGNSGRQEVEGLRKEMDRQLATVLTEEQMEKHREKDQARRQRMRERKGRRGRGPRW